jgi:hypothetical protein
MLIKRFDLTCFAAALAFICAVKSAGAGPFDNFGLYVGEQHRAALEQEFAKIPLIPSATVVNKWDDRQTNDAVVGATFKAPAAMSPEDLRAHYDKALSEQGWVFRREEAYRGDGKRIIYCKGEDQAALFLAGKQSSSDWDFGFITSWGEKTACTKG